MKGSLPISTLIIAAICLSGCSSVSSIKEPGKLDGLVYYLPNRDIKIEVTVKDKKLDGVTIGASQPYADYYAGPYLLRYNKNYFGKNKLDVSVSTGGLLTSAKAAAEDRTSGLSSIGQLAGFARGLDSNLQSGPPPATTERAENLPGPCALDGTHRFLFRAGAITDAEICGSALKVTIEPLFPTKNPTPTTPQGDQAGKPKEGTEGSRGETDKPAEHKKGTYSGVFYRMGRPYLVKVDGKIRAEVIVNSPSHASELFLPISGTFAATNDAEITISEGEGTPTKYKQETEGEISAALKVPALIVTPYFAAIGSVFGSFSANSKAEATARADQVKLELAKKKQEDCNTAIRDKDAAAIEALGCSK